MPLSYELIHGLGDEHTNFWFKRPTALARPAVFSFGIELEDESGLIELEDGSGLIELEDGT